MAVVAVAAERVLRQSQPQSAPRKAERRTLMSPVVVVRLGQIRRQRQGEMG